MSKKKLLIIIISSAAALIVAAVAIVLAIVLSNQSNENSEIRYLDSARTIKIVELEGSANVTDDRETIACFKGMNLYDGDSVDVLADSVLVIKFDEDKYVYLGENTKINLKSEGKDSFKTNIFVETGVVLAEIQKPLGEDEEFFLSSNNSVMAVRGTIFGVAVKEVANEIIQTYSVYKGVTELFIFDKMGDELIKGKLTNISNSKIELTVPKENILESGVFNEIVGNLANETVDHFNNSNDANSKLDEVEITVGKPSKEDYQNVMDKVTGSSVTYSTIDYTVEGYFGSYDGNSHSINLDVKTENAKISYKESEEGTYQDTLPTFKAPGSYRVYFKISCEGYDDKEDYSVVQINKADLLVEYNNIPTQGFIVGMNVNNALAKINLFDYVVIKGVEEDATELLKSTFASEEKLIDGTNSYQINLVLPDSIKTYYNDVVLNISLNAAPVTLNHSKGISSGYVYLDEITKFNKYNGVAESELFGNPAFYAGDSMITDATSYEFNYTYKTEGYYELKTGKNTVEVVLHFDGYDITSSIEFMFEDFRGQPMIAITIDDVSVVKLAEDTYYFNTNDLNVTNDEYQITSTYLLEHLGLDDFSGYINLPTDVLDDESVNYQVSDTYVLSFPKDDTSFVELVLFPNSSSKGAIRRLSIYFSTIAPTGYPEYEFTNSLAFSPNSNISFIVSELPVQYSLDGITYQDSLSISELGDYDVYYKVGDTVIAKGIKTITITNGVIAMDSYAANLINAPLVLSDDGRSLMYYDSTLGGDGGYTFITSSDNSTISSNDDLYQIYSDIVKNSKYYNSLTNEELEVEVFVSEKEEQSADFTYEVVSNGYLSLKGSVEFNYSNIVNYNPKQGYSGDLEYFNGTLYVVNPSDKTVSLSEIDEVYPSRIAYSIEDLYTYEAEFEILYSIDGGKTWTTDIPVLTQAGEYDVYEIYKVTYTNDDDEKGPKTIVKIQHISITE